MSLLRRRWTCLPLKSVRSTHAVDVDVDSLFTIDDLTAQNLERFLGVVDAIDVRAKLHQLPFVATEQRDGMIERTPARGQDAFERDFLQDQLVRHQTFQRSAFLEAGQHDPSARTHNFHRLNERLDRARGHVQDDVDAEIAGELLRAGDRIFLSTMIVA